MNKFLFLIAITLFHNTAFCQLEISTGYAVNKNLLDGAPLQIAYDIRISNRLFTKPQFGFKYLQHFNDFVGAKLKVSIVELHQTLSYEIIAKRKYVLKPNIGINYRFYSWKGEMVRPLNSLPIRGYSVEFRKGRLNLVSTDAEYKDDYKTSNLGFTFQLQNQFRLSDKIILHVTPFVEPDYDGTQNVGGCYIGIIFKNLK
jgi:hypothetical protein